MKKITEMKNLKKTAAALTAAVLMTSAASAQVVYEQDFGGTQYDLFGSNFNYTAGNANHIKFLFPGETVENEDGTTTLNPKDYGTPQLSINPDTIGIDNNDAVSFFSIENEKGVITKIGRRGSMNRYGFKKSIAEETAAFNKAEYEKENGEATEDMTFDSVIKSGVWNFDFTLQSMQGTKYFVLRSGNTEKLAVKLEKWAENVGIADTIDKASTNKIGKDNIDNNGANYGHAAAWDTGAENFLRLQIDFDKQTLQIFRNTRTPENPNWKLVTRIPIKDESGNITGYDDESGISLEKFGVDLSEGIDSFGYEEIFHGNPCRMIIDDIKIARVSDGAELYSCSFDDAEKDSWQDYGFESTSKYTTAWMEDGRLNYRSATNDYRDTVIDREIGENADSGVWAVTVKYWAEGLQPNNSSVPASVSGGTRSFINFLNDEHNTYSTLNGYVNDVALGVSCGGYNYPHMWQVTCLNGETKSDLLNANCKKPDGKSLSIEPENGAEYKFVFDFNAHKMYVYAKFIYNNRDFSVVNPEGYDLPAGFSFNKIRLFDTSAGKKAWAAWDSLKIEKFDSEKNVRITTDSDFVGSGDIVGIGVESFRAPSEESKDTYIDSSKISIVSAIYEGDKLVNVKVSENVQHSAFEEFKTDLSFDNSGDYTVKVFAMDPESFKPLTDVKELTWVNMD